MSGEMDFVITRFGSLMVVVTLSFPENVASGFESPSKSTPKFVDRSLSWVEPVPTVSFLTRAVTR